jgi:hypothetical protein
MKLDAVLRNHTALLEMERYVDARIGRLRAGNEEDKDNWGAVLTRRSV